MKWLEEFGCDTCGVKFVNKAVESRTGDFFFNVYACHKCCRFRCEKCFASQSACNCGKRMEFYFTLDSFFALLRCPVEELKLMDIRVVTSSACHECGSKGDLYRFYFHIIICENCLIRNDQKDCWPKTCALEHWFLIMDEFTSIKVSTPELRNTPLTIKMSCPKCTNNYDFVTSRLLECKNCDTSWNFKCDCMYAFWLILWNILSFSKNQLILLTYSKWMDAFSCSECRNEEHETLMKSIAVEGSNYEDVPLHTLFKKNVPKSPTSSISLGQFLLEEASGRNASTTASTSNNYSQLSRPHPSISPSKEMLERSGTSLLESRKVVHPTLSSLDRPRPRIKPSKEMLERAGNSLLESRKFVHLTVSSIDTRDPSNYGNISTMGTGQKPYVATMLKCKCGRVDDLKDTFYCRTCSEHGICSLCVLRKHKTHQTEEAMNWSIMGIVGKHSEKNLKKIHAWAEEYRQVNSESKENYRQLCELLGAVYKRASTCGDIERCREILSKCDMDRVDYHIKHLLHSMKKSNDEIKEFRTMLENI